jgi:hypothetical protein
MVTKAIVAEQQGVCDVTQHLQGEFEQEGPKRGFETDADRKTRGNAC